MQTSEKVSEIIRKWYKEISFDSKYDVEFNEALQNIYVDENAKANDYNPEEKDGKKNFLYFLYFCEELKRKYEEKGIPLKYLFDNLQDMPRWLDTWSDIKGKLYFGELTWFRWHFKPQLFKIGRLQYFMYQSFDDIPEKNIKNGDNILAMHIPADGPLLEEKCIESIKEAQEFFKKYYPEFKYKHITCHSWLLGDTIDTLMKKDSNIMKFKNLFDVLRQDETDGILNYVIGWQKTREDVKKMQFDSRLQNEIKARILSDEKFFAGLGVIKDKYLI